MGLLQKCSESQFVRSKEELVANLRMDPDELLSAIHQRKEQLEQLLIGLQTRNENAPIGTLRISQRGQYLQYYHRTDPKDTKGHYMKRTHDGIARKLAQKDYDLRIIAEVTKEIEALEECVKKYHPDIIREIYRNLHPNRKNLVQPVFLETEEFVKEWLSQEYEKKGFLKDSPKYYTDLGEQVRSKSEILIANKLLKLGVPYRYEYPIRFVSGREVHPDFYCLNVHTRREYAWEHFGMMDNGEYVNNAIKKIEEYEQNGYWIGQNLIVTFESMNNPINLNILEKTIQHYLL